MTLLNKLKKLKDWNIEKIYDEYLHRNIYEYSDMNVLLRCNTLEELKKQIIKL
jgi:hypothetical protein